jgi:hypothetical protein
MSWQRLPFKMVPAHPNKNLVHDIGAFLDNCYYGQRPILNRTPFISIRVIAPAIAAMDYEMSSMVATAKDVHRNYYQSFWVKDVQRLTRPLDRPIVMTRTWLQPRPYDSVYWLTLFQIFDEAHDHDKMTSVAMSRWYPNDKELAQQQNLTGDCAARPYLK